MSVMSKRRSVESAYDRHVRMLQEARVYYRHAAPAVAAGVTDADVLREAHRFVRDEAADAAAIASGDWCVACVRACVRGVCACVFVCVCMCVRGFVCFEFLLLFACRLCAVVCAELACRCAFT
jgi:hypothetical protein